MNSGEKPALTRPELVLEHIALYGLTLTPIVSRLFCGGNETTTRNLFRTLHEQRRIVSYSLNRASGLKYHVLSPDEARRRATAIVSGKLSGKAILTAVSVLCFCYATPKVHRRRAFLPELEDEMKFPLKSKSASYFVEQGPEYYVGRVIVPGPKALPTYAIDQISKDAHRLFAFPEARDWFAKRAYRYVVLVESEARRALFAEAIKLAESGKLPKGVPVDVACVPDLLKPVTLAKETQS